MKTKSLGILLIGVGLLFQANCTGNNSSDTKAANENEVASNTDPNDWTTNRGIGPVTTISLSEEIDESLVEEGKAIFITKCSACHKTDKKYIGPSMADLFERRSPEWVMNMILNPDGMVKEDPIAKDLLMEYNGTPMANQNLSEDEARAVLEYFRTLKSE